MNDDQLKPTTTDAGIPVARDEHSLTIGPDGPILLQDHYLIESRWPTSTGSASRSASHMPRGSGAFGYFQVTHDVSAYTRGGCFSPAPRPRR
jgi:catalase